MINNILKIIIAIIFLHFTSCTNHDFKAKQRNVDPNGYTRISCLISGDTMSVKNSEFTGRNKKYAGRTLVYKNDTGENLIRYVVTYTREGIDETEPIRGELIKPNDYVDGIDVDGRFTQPPYQIPFPAVKVYSRYGRSAAKRMQLCRHFIDYAKNVRFNVVFNEE